MRNPSSFYGEEGTVATCPVVTDILAALAKHTLPLWYIRAALCCVLDFYEIGPELEARFGRERFMEINEERN